MISISVYFIQTASQQSCCHSAMTALLWTLKYCCWSCTGSNVTRNLVIRYYDIPFLCMYMYHDVQFSLLCWLGILGGGHGPLAPFPLNPPMSWVCILFVKVCWYCLAEIIKISPCLSKLQLAKVGVFFWDTVYFIGVTTHKPLTL